MSNVDVKLDCNIALTYISICYSGRS